MSMRLRFCSRRVAVLQNPDLVVLEDYFVFVRIGVRRVQVVHGPFLSLNGLVRYNECVRGVLPSGFVQALKSRAAAVIICGAAAACSSPSMTPLQFAPNAHPVFSQAGPACPANPKGTGLLSDGDFHEATNQTDYHAGQAPAPGWKVTIGRIDLVGRYTSGAWPTPNGVCSVDLDGTGKTLKNITVGGLVHSSFVTKSGARYSLTFLPSGNGDPGPNPSPVVKTVRVSAAGQSQTFTWDTSNGNNAQKGKLGFMKWEFTAKSSTTALAFISLDKPDNSWAGPVIAAISVHRTPR